MARVVLVVLASLLVAGGGQLDSLLGLQEQREPSSEQGSDQGSSPTTPKFDPKGVGDTVEVGPFLVTLNNAKASSGDNQNESTDGHHYAVADLTLENNAEAPLNASDADYLLRDERGYSFDTESLPEQKPQPGGQVMPGGKASGEVAFDLGPEPIKGPLTLTVSLSGEQDVSSAAFAFEVNVDKATKPPPEPEDVGREDNAISPVEPDYKEIEDPTGSLTVEVPSSWEAARPYAVSHSLVSTNCIAERVEGLE